MQKRARHLNYKIQKNLCLLCALLTSLLNGGPISSFVAFVYFFETEDYDRAISRLVMVHSKRKGQSRCVIINHPVGASLWILMTEIKMNTCASAVGSSLDIHFGPQSQPQGIIVEELQAPMVAKIFITVIM